MKEIKKGKLIVLEACDGSGKATQTKKLYERLILEGYDVLKVEYPNYESDSSALIKMYLNGEFGDKPEDVNAYTASTFYAVDRYASFKKHWEGFYDKGGIVLADRYTTSNMVHQASKIDNLEEKNKFLNWLCDLEFNLMGLPIPDVVVFLNMPPEYSKKLISNRKNKFTGEEEKDIHEKNEEYLIHSYKNACKIAEKYNWKQIDCISAGNIKTIDDIHEEIYEAIIKKL
ncbi:Thymidylate kinase [Clostridium liquoris]|uniref:Thymidylate kinase n=1 Tax=Clostridium liquoris TaxID=1289519 RepID=A0A2T0B2A1_9CLOT|nr:deoxynucleoside kinase [Clostridium liquoris]PRR77881.1 Thymidylate kinase [Clostridium liquoris]